ncbi:BTB/POZ protein [Rhizophagus irregularis DAOM 181602=DAOM 197198]|nr:BTB/POZ protein [Rhizophagus irregularis DAOM 181602=DAOM 197198]
MVSNFYLVDYEKLFETELGYDVIIYSGEESNVKEIHAHSNILCIRSNYFRSAFSNEWAEKEDEMLIKRDDLNMEEIEIWEVLLNGVLLNKI